MAPEKRKILNFGHTIGHAVETLSLSENGDVRLSHGEAIAAGMIMESFLSKQDAGLPEKDVHLISNCLKVLYTKVNPAILDFEKLQKIMHFDKKNMQYKSRFTLLNSIGKASIDHTCEAENIQRSVEYYIENI